MRISPGVALLFLLTAGCLIESDVSPGSVGVGHWVPFYGRNFGQGRLDYFYDKSRVHRGNGHVVARWKVVSTPPVSTTLYVIDIACRDGTFTEKGTELVDAEGRTRELPRQELMVDRPIETGTSGDVFRRTFCQ